MKNRKEKRRGEGLESPGSSAQPAPSRARPSLRPNNARALPAFARCRCRWTPRVSRTTPTPARLPASACSRCRWTPHVSPTILLLHAVHDHRTTEPRQQWQGGPGVHARGMALPPLGPRPRNHARPSDGMHASDPPQSPAAERRAPWPSSAIKAPAPEP